MIKPDPDVISTLVMGRPDMVRGLLKKLKDLHNRRLGCISLQAQVTSPADLAKTPPGTYGGTV